VFVARADLFAVDRLRQRQRASEPPALALSPVIARPVFGRLEGSLSADRQLLAPRSDLDAVFVESRDLGANQERLTVVIETALWKNARAIDSQPGVAHHPEQLVENSSSILINTEHDNLRRAASWTRTRARQVEKTPRLPAFSPLSSTLAGRNKS